MDWNDNNFDGLSDEVDWDNLAEKAAKVKQWRDLSDFADRQTQRMNDTIVEIEQHCETLAQSLYPAETFPTSTSVVSTQFWQAKHPGITALLKHCDNLKDNVSKLKVRLETSANRVERVPLQTVRVREEFRNERDASRLMAEPLFNQIKLLKVLGDCAQLWKKLPISHAEQNAADEGLKKVFALRILSDSLAIETNIDKIQDLAEHVNNQALLFDHLIKQAVTAFPEAKQGSEPRSGPPLQPAFPNAITHPAQELGHQVISGVLAGESAADATKIRGDLKLVSRAFYDLVTGTPASVSEALKETHMKLVQAANIQNNNFTSATLEKRLATVKNLATRATAGAAHVGLDLTQIPKEHRETVLDTVLREPRETLAIKASGIQPISDLLDKLQTFHQKNPSKLKDIRLDLSNTDLRSDDLKLLQGLPVTLLYAAHNQDIGDAGFEHIANFGRLTALDVSSTDINPIALNTITSKVEGLKELYLNDLCSNDGFFSFDGSQVANALLDELKKINSSLEVLEFRGNSATSESAISIGELDNLRRLDISNNPTIFNSPTNDWVTAPNFGIRPERYLVKLEKLTHLAVSNIGLEDEKAIYLLKWEPWGQSLPNLKHFDASDNQLTENIVPTLKEHPSLQEVNLRGNRQRVYLGNGSFTHKETFSEETLQQMAKEMPGLKKLNGRGRDAKNGKLERDFTDKSPPLNNPPHRSGR